MSFPKVEDMSEDAIRQFLAGLGDDERRAAEKVVARRLELRDRGLGDTERLELTNRLDEAAELCRARALVLEKQLADDFRWAVVGELVLQVVKERGPALAQALLGLAVRRAADWVQEQAEDRR